MNDALKERTQQILESLPAQERTECIYLLVASESNTPEQVMDALLNRASANAKQKAIEILQLRLEYKKSLLSGGN